MKLLIVFLALNSFIFSTHAQQGMGAMGGASLDAEQARVIALDAAIDSNANIEDQFRQAYQLYQTHKAAREAGDISFESINYDHYALRAYELGKQIYPENSLNHMKLALNLGEALQRRGPASASQAMDLYKEGLQAAIVNFGETAPELIPVYQKVSEATLYLGREGSLAKVEYRQRALAIAESLYGKNSPELILLLIELGEAKNSISFNNSLSDFKRAISISEQVFGQESAEVGMLTLRIGQLLYQFSSNQTLRYLKDSIEVLEQYPDQTYSLGIAYLNLGKTYLWEDRRVGNAEDSFLLALDNFEAAPASANTYFVEVVARAMLLETLERQEKFAEADRHVQYIKYDDAVTMGFVDGLIYSPISYIGSPSSRTAGAVDLYFQVGTDGRVKEASYESIEGFEIPPDAILEDIEAGLYARRYAPKWEDGELVEFDSRIRYIFE